MDEFINSTFYVPLQGKEIRLLHIKPGNSIFTIECTLETADLEAKPNYEALSYEWGDENTTTERSPGKIMVGENMVDVRDNL